jgi:hypothetical protein
VITGHPLLGPLPALVALLFAIFLPQTLPLYSKKKREKERKKMLKTTSYNNIVKKRPDSDFLNPRFFSTLIKEYLWSAITHTVSMVFRGDLLCVKHQTQSFLTPAPPQPQSAQKHFQYS